MVILVGFVVVYSSLQYFSEPLQTCGQTKNSSICQLQISTILSNVYTFLLTNVLVVTCSRSVYKITKLMYMISLFILIQWCLQQANLFYTSDTWPELLESTK